MLTYFPKYFSIRAILCYVATLALVSALFMSYAMPFQFMLFGLVPVMIFFFCSNTLTVDWRRLKPRTFVKRLFLTAFLIRVAYVIFIYFYYIAKTGVPHAYYAADELFYEYIGALLREVGFEEFKNLLTKYVVGFSDSGYCWWLGLENLLFGSHALPPRFIKCVIDAFSCVLLYNLAKRNFGEWVGRMAAIFYMLLPNAWYYCGVTLKETEMAFLVVLFVERGDMALHSPKITIQNILLPGLIIIAMFAFRTALGAVLVAAFVGALVLSSGKQMQAWKKILYSTVFIGWMSMTVGVEIVQETQQIWQGRFSNQSQGYEWRAESNSFAKYASAAVFAPLIFTIPFSSMVATPGQENQMMMNGANFIKNIVSGFVIFALFSLLLSKEWRKHVLPIAVMSGYLVVLVFSNFAHSERFHYPVMALEMMFVAYGISLMKNKHKRLFTIWLIGIGLANFLWAWVKLSGRGLT